ncbi:hypothetical protein [Halorientalis marina]|uniref:hypothetical protein n=1 Tax=Halorientalis marina TaxID=2931976 RepID=UPI001FF19AA4|nr:hypothetical protein [Halorientalis marina]
MSDDEQQEESRSGRDVSRRRLIAAGGLAAFSLGTAGCSQITDSGGDDADEDEDDDEDEEVTESTDTPTATPAEENGIRTISFGETRDGYIDSEDENDPVDGDLAEPVALAAEGGTVAEITMESSDLDTYLILEAPDGSIVEENDDGARGFNSRLQAELEQTGTYTIWAGTFEGDEVGAYTLSVSEIDVSNRPDLESIAFGETREGFVDAGDGSDPADGDLAEGVRLDAESGITAQITMQAEFDTYLILEGPDGSVVAEDDDGGTGLNSRIRTRLPQTGTYTIWAGSFSGTDTGRYTLSVEESDPSEQPDLESIDFGETREGYIDTADGTDPVDGDLAEPVALEAESGMQANITMEADFDTYLILEAPDGTIVAENDDGASGLDSRILAELEQTGTYTIWAGSFSGTDTGSYILSVAAADIPEGRDLESISFGESREGFIDNGDGADPRYDKLAEPVALEAESGTTAVISMESEELDTFLVLETPDGTVVAEDDDGGSGLNSRLQAELEQTGTYTIWATTFGGSDTGLYTLSVEQR